ncbi:MAG: PACE efflux transporter [Rhodobacteraceae bacterium]|nr:PACE efflux transporter [Paracoccaceae bacterium]
MPLRTFRDRVFQTLCYEGGALLVVAPGFALVTGKGQGDSFLLLASLSAAVMVWSPLHNTVFDLIDLRMTGRVASDRPQGLRVVHALSYEASSMVVTLPVLIWLGGFGLWEAVAADLGLTGVYALYAYLFFLAYDRLRPVRPGP